MSEEVETKFEYDGKEFWWPQCSVDGCMNHANLGAGTGKCHPHTYTKLHHKIQRFIRRLLP